MNLVLLSYKMAFKSKMEAGWFIMYSEHLTFFFSLIVQKVFFFIVWEWLWCVLINSTFLPPAFQLLWYPSYWFSLPTSCHPFETYWSLLSAVRICVSSRPSTGTRQPFRGHVLNKLILTSAGSCQLPTAVQPGVGLPDSSPVHSGVLAGLTLCR